MLTRLWPCNGCHGPGPPSETSEGSIDMADKSPNTSSGKKVAQSSLKEKRAAKKLKKDGPPSGLIPNKPQGGRS